MKAFNVTGAPKTLEEAQERPVYAMVFWQHLQLQCLGRMVSHVMEAVFCSLFPGSLLGMSKWHLYAKCHEYDPCASPGCIVDNHYKSV